MFASDGFGFALAKMVKMRIRRQLSLRGLRTNHSASPKESDEETFRFVYRNYRRDLRFSRGRFESVAEYINEIFRSLAKYDARFDFDPMSIDDCRCEVISASEVKLICELKQLSEQSYSVVGDTADGTVKIQLREDGLRENQACWDDIRTRRTRRTEPNFLNTRALLDVFLAALGRAVRDVWNEHRNVGLVYRVTGNQARIYVDIPDNGFFTVTLVPAIRVGNRVGLNANSFEFLRRLGIRDDFASVCHAIAQPDRNHAEDRWHLSFKSLENQILQAEQFICGHVCLYALRHLLHLSKSPRCDVTPLTLAQLRLAVMQEYARYSDANDWVPAKFVKRLTGIITSLRLCLKEGVCVNPLSGVNVFADFDAKSLKVLAREMDHLETRSKEKLLRMWR